jgi:hypothetical protein
MDFLAAVSDERVSLGSICLVLVMVATLLRTRLGFKKIFILNLKWRKECAKRARPA